MQQSSVSSPSSIPLKGRTIHRPLSHIPRLSVLLLALLPLLFLWKLTLAGRILVGLDPFNFFYPYHDALAAAFAEGRLPEWNPALFGGVPFLADLQAQVFYPLAWPFLLFSAPAALTWGIVLHLAIAAVGVYAWARRGLGMGAWGAWVAGVVFALGGYLGAQVEHVNQVQAAAWLPWLLLGYEVARTRRWGVVLGSVALGMSFLAGHTQTTFISLVMLGLWVVRCAVRDAGRMRDEAVSLQRFGPSLPLTGTVVRDFLRVNALPLLLIVGIGALLAAIQVVPTQALSALSPRAGGLSLREAASFSLDPRVLPRALLPTFGRDEHLLSEYVGWVGFLGLGLAAIGLLSKNRAARDFGALASVSGLLLAFGGYNPLFWILWRIVPGFDLFRAPARWLLLWALGAAVLAGAGIEVLHAARRGDEEGFVRLPPLRTLLRRRVVQLGLVGWLGVGALFLVLGDWPSRGAWLWWLLALCLTATVVFLHRVWPRRIPVPYSGLVVAVLLLELWGASWGLDYQKATAPEAYSGLRPAPAHLITVQPEMGVARLLSLSDLTWDPGDLAALQARHAGLLSEEAIYDSVVVTKLKEVLAPNQPMRWGLQTADGYGGGLLPTARWVEFQRTLPLAEVVPDGRLREQLTGILSTSLLDVMGVEWLVADKVDDWWSENVYHDLGAPVSISAGESLTWEMPPWQGTAISFVVFGEWPANPGTFTLDGRTVSLVEAEERTTRETWHGTERHFLLSIEPPAALSELTLTSDADWTLGGLSLVDSRLPAFQPFAANPDFQITFSGDVKVYRRADTLGRAWLVGDGVAVETAAQAADLVSKAELDPRETVILEDNGEAASQSGGAGIVTWERDEPGNVALRVSAPEGGWLVLADAPAPGWRATLDGVETEWYAANVISRAVWVPPGEHVVEWEYRTPGLQLGMAGTLLGVLALGGWVLYAARRA